KPLMAWLGKEGVKIAQDPSKGSKTKISREAGFCYNQHTKYENYQNRPQILRLLENNSGISLDKTLEKTREY
ncbi:MAG: hypothetical protein KGI79_00005, partial [Patescibacteria group bacterium]|nr:hypothetical protein [Patescibacteria group bacterium]